MYDVNKGSSAAGRAGLSTLCYVDPAGNDATAQRGSIVLKFKTVQAALNACLDGDTIDIAPGTYLENLVMPQRDGLTIQGEGNSGSVTIQNNGVGVPLTWTSGAAGGVHFCRFNSVAIKQTGAGGETRLVVLDGTAAAGADFLDSGLTFFDCLLAGPFVGPFVDIIAKTVGEVAFFQSDGFRTNMQATNVNAVTVADVSSLSGITYQYDPTVVGVPLPAGSSSREGLQIKNNSNLPNIVLKGATVFGIDTSSNCNGIDGSALASFKAPNPVLAPKMHLNGIFNGNVTLSFPDATFDPAIHTASVCFIEADNGRFHGTFDYESVGATTLTPLTIQAQDAAFYGTTTVGNKNVIDMRGSYFGTLVQAPATDGAIDRDTVRIVGRTLPATGGFDQPSIDPPFPAYVGENDYGILVERWDAGGGLPVNFCAFVTFSKTNAGFKVTQNTATPQTVQYTLTRRTP